MEFLNKFLRIISSKKITHTLLNIMVVLVIMLLIIATSDLWRGVIGAVWLVSRPFIIGFTIAFVLNPLINFVDKYVKKRSISVMLIYLAALAILILIISLAVPMIYDSISEMFPAFNSGLKEIGVFIKNNFNYDISSLTSYIQNIVSEFFNDSTVLDTTIDVLNQVLINVTNILIYLILAIYMSSNFNHIRQTIKKITRKIDHNLPTYLKEIDLSLVQYVKAFFIGAIAQAITTMLMYLLIGHPNWLILGFVSGVSSIIPYVGPIAANCLGLITSLGMGTTTIIILCVLIFIQSTVMSYIITPKIYSSRIDLGIMWVLFGILSGSSLFGMLGMIIAMPLLVSVKVTYQVYKEHHYDKITV
ncbi:AI-2E family transporter [Thomasclavelia sp.]